MSFDFRTTLGFLFLIYGALLACYGFLHRTTHYAHSLGINANLVWGLVLLIVGAVFSLAARRSRNRHTRNTTSL